jgi:hypothetical protein
MTTPVEGRDHEGLLAGVACAGGAALAVGSSVAVLGLLTDYEAPLAARVADNGARPPVATGAILSAR